MDGLADFQVLTQYLHDGLCGLCTGCDECIHTGLEVGESLGHCCVEHNHGSCTVGLRAYSAELEAVACEGEWRCAVAVSIVQHQFGYLGDVEAECLLACQIEQLVVIGLLQFLQQFGELLAQEA